MPRIHSIIDQCAERIVGVYLLYKLAFNGFLIYTQRQNAIVFMCMCMRISHAVHLNIFIKEKIEQIVHDYIQIHALSPFPLFEFSVTKLLVQFCINSISHLLKILKIWNVFRPQFIKKKRILSYSIAGIYINISMISRVERDYFMCIYS